MLIMIKYKNIKNDLYLKLNSDHYRKTLLSPSMLKYFTSSTEHIRLILTFGISTFQKNN